MDLQRKQVITGRNSRLLIYCMANLLIIKDDPRFFSAGEQWLTAWSERHILLSWSKKIRLIACCLFIKTQIRVESPANL